MTELLVNSLEKRGVVSAIENALTNDLELAICHRSNTHSFNATVDCDSSQQEVRMEIFGNEDGTTLDTENLTYISQRLRKGHIGSVTLAGLQIQGTFHDLNGLKQLYLRDCNFEGDDIDAAAQSISELPSLEDFTIIFSDKKGSISDSDKMKMVTTICGSCSSLRSAQFYKLPSHADFKASYQLFANAVSSSNIRHLDLGNSPLKSDLVDVIIGLIQNSVSLCDLEICLDSGGDVGRLMDVLGSNDVLKTLQIGYDNGSVPPQVFKRLAEILRTQNTSLREIEMFALASSEECPNPDDTLDLAMRKEIEFYLMLNDSEHISSSRRRLLKDGSLSVRGFVNLLPTPNDTVPEEQYLSMLYTFMSTRPDLWCGALPIKEDTKRSVKRACSGQFDLPRAKRVAVERS